MATPGVASPKEGPAPGAPRIYGAGVLDEGVKGRPPLLVLANLSGKVYSCRVAIQKAKKQARNALAK